MRPLLWTSKSLHKIAKAMKARGFNVAHVTEREILKTGYSLQGNKKTDEVGDLIDRDAQFEYINQIATTFIQQGTLSFQSIAKERTYWKL